MLLLLVEMFGNTHIRCALKAKTTVECLYNRVHCSVEGRLGFVCTVVGWLKLVLIPALPSARTLRVGRGFDQQ